MYMSMIVGFIRGSPHAGSRCLSERQTVQDRCQACRERGSQYGEKHRSSVMISPHDFSHRFESLRRGLFSLCVSQADYVSAPIDLTREYAEWRKPETGRPYRISTYVHRRP